MRNDHVFRDALASHARWLRGCGGNALSLPYFDLRGADLRSLDLRRAGLYESDLREAEMSFIKL